MLSMKAKSRTYYLGKATAEMSSFKRALLLSWLLAGPDFVPFAPSNSRGSTQQSSTNSWSKTLESLPFLSLESRPKSLMSFLDMALSSLVFGFRRSVLLAFVYYSLKVPKILEI